MRLSAEYLVEKYQENIFRAAFSICRNREDAEDVVQNTFLQYLHTKQEFDSEEHIRAWLLRTAVNQSKNMVKAFWRRNRTSLEEYMAEVPFREPQDRSLVEAVLALPESCRIVIHLYYYEGYSVQEIASMLALPENTVKSHLFRARDMLRQQLKEAYQDV